MSPALAVENSRGGSPTLFNHRSFKKPAGFPGFRGFREKKDPWREPLEKSPLTEYQSGVPVPSQLRHAQGITESGEKSQFGFDPGKKASLLVFLETNPKRVAQKMGLAVTPALQIQSGPTRIRNPMQRFRVTFDK